MTAPRCALLLLFLAACSGGAAHPTGTGSGGGGAGGSGGAQAGGAGGDAGLPACAATWAGDRQEGTADDDQILDLIAGAEGDLYVVGYEGGITGVTNVQPSGDARAFVARYGATGSAIWKKTIDTPGTDTAEAVAIDADHGEIHVAGRTSGALGGASNQGQFDAFLTVLDPEGEVRATFQAGRDRPEHPARLAVGGGRAVIAGYDDLFVDHQTVQALEDGFVLALDVDRSQDVTLSEAWWRRASSEAPDQITGVALDPEGSLYVTGYEFGGTGAFVEKRDAQGTRRWIRGAQDLGVQAANAIARAPGGDLLVAAARFPSGGPPDVVVMRLDAATGATRWEAQAEAPDYDWPTSLALDATGNVYAAGFTYGSFAEGNASQGKRDLIALKIDAAGAIASRWQRGTPGDDVPAAIAVDRCGRVFLAGYTEGELVPGLANKGKRDTFLLALDL